MKTRGGGVRVAIKMIAPDRCLANPYRHIERYRISEEKVDALLSSYKQSGFWDGSIQARPAKDGCVEIAFGHHRVEAARRAGLKQIGVVVAPRSNADMLLMMADENREEFKHDALVAVETIAAVIEAYGRDEIELDPVPNKSPGGSVYVIPGGITSPPPAGAIPRDGTGGWTRGGKPYTCLTVARFLGWTKANGTQANSACRAAFDAYRERASTHEALASIPTGQRSEVAIGVVVGAARAARAAATKAGATPAKIRKAEVAAATDAAKQVVEQGGFRARDLSVEIGKAAARKVVEPKAKGLPQIEVYAARLIAKCERPKTPYSDILTDCRRLVPFVDDLDAKLARTVAAALETMLRRDAEGVRGVVVALRSGDGVMIKKALEA